MRDYTRGFITILTTVLALWLVLGFWPVSTASRLVLSFCVLLICGAVLWRLRQLLRFRQSASGQIKENNLPPEDFQGAVVLVCGDTTQLFPADMAHRETCQGWYLKAKNAEQLPLLAQQLASVRPALVSQISVMLSVLPEQKTSEEAFAQSIRGWRRSIVQCGIWLNGLPPVWNVAWVTPPDTGHQHEKDVCWFTLTPDLPGVRVRQSGHVALPVADWLRESGNHTCRFYHALWLESALTLTDWYLTRPLSTRQGELTPLKSCAMGICLTPVAAVAENLWQQHIAGVTTLRPDAPCVSDILPLPDILLPYVPRFKGISRRMNDMRLVGGVCFLFLVLAMLASFINNQRLIRSVGDHLAVYHQLSGTPPLPKLHAQQRLRNDSRQLDDWMQKGEPLRYGLGLYQGMRLIPALEAAISDWTPPPSPLPVIKQIVQGPQTVRLDSMSLFDTGKWALKPGSTRMLVKSLVGIKAKPGWLIIVAGHTDSVGDDKSNQTLSLKRAESVRNWMRDTGDLPESCFAVQGYGESRPVATNDTPQGRALNRRVEISLVPQANACQSPGNPPASLQDDDVSKNEME